MIVNRIWLLCLILFSTAGMAAQNNAFDIMEYQIEGNTLLSERQIDQAVYPHLGEHKTIDDVELARSALELAYHDAGYLTVLVNIPEQTVAGGIVRLNVVAGSIEKVRVVGSRYYSLGRILAQAPQLAPGSVPYFPALQEELAALNRDPVNLKVTPVLRAGSTPGTVAADLKVDDQLPVHTSIELDNYNSPDTDPLRLSGMVRYDNLWQLQHSLSLTYQMSPQNLSQVKVLSGTYLIPLPADEQLVFYSVISRSNVVATAGDTTIFGTGEIVGTRWIKPLPSRGQYFQTLTMGADYKNFDNNVSIAGSNASNTPLAYVPFSVDYSGNTSDDVSATQGNLTLNFKLRGPGDKTVLCHGQTLNQFACDRYMAQSEYIYLRGGVNTTHVLPLGMSVYAKVDGQVSNGPLITNEEFTAGGEISVRGYYEAEAAADNGVHSTMELRGPQWTAWGLTHLTMLAFYDAAALSVIDPLALQTSRFILESVGLGLRTDMRKFSMMLDLAWPLKNDLPYTQAGSWHLGFKTLYAF